MIRIKTENCLVDDRLGVRFCLRASSAVDKAGRHVEKITEKHRMLRRNQILRGSDLLIGEGRNVFCNRVIEIDDTILQEKHHRCCCHRLCL